MGKTGARTAGGTGAVFMANPAHFATGTHISISSADGLGSNCYNFGLPVSRNHS
jgi:hypothetical protein